MSNQNQGPLMLCATRILKPPPTTIVKIGGNLNLPRPVAVRSVAAGAAGAIPLMLIGVAIGGFQGLLFGLVIGAGIGVGFTTWEPQKGETLGKLLGVAAQSRMRRKPLELDGETVSVSIGIARISRVAEGYVHILPGAVPVNPDDYDERGVRRSVENRNLLDPAERDADIVAGLGARSHFPNLDEPTDEPTGVDDFRIPVPGETPATPAPAPRRRRRAPEENTPQGAAAPAVGADEFTIPAPGHPTPAVTKRWRGRRHDTPDAEPALSTPHEPAWVDDGPVAAPVAPPAAAPVEMPAPAAPTPPIVAPEPVPSPAPAAAADFRIPAPGEPVGPAPAKRRLGRRHRDTTASPAPVPPAPIPAPAPVPSAPAPVAVAPSPMTPHAPAPPHAPSAPHAPTAPPAPGFAGIAPPGAPAKRRKRRKDHDDEPSMLDAWPDPLAGDR